MTITYPIAEIGPVPPGTSATGLAGSASIVAPRPDVVYNVQVILEDVASISEKVDGAGVIWPIDSPESELLGLGPVYAAMPADAADTISNNAIIRVVRRVTAGDPSLTVWDHQGAGAPVHQLNLPGVSLVAGPVFDEAGLIYFITHTGPTMQAQVTRGDLTKPSDSMAGADPLGTPVGIGAAPGDGFRGVWITDDHLVTLDGTGNSPTDAFVWELVGGTFTTRTLNTALIFATDEWEAPGIPLGGGSFTYGRTAVDDMWTSRLLTVGVNVDYVATSPARLNTAVWPWAPHLVPATAGTVLAYGLDVGHLHVFTDPMTDATEWNAFDGSTPEVQKMRFVWPDYGA